MPPAGRNWAASTTTPWADRWSSRTPTTSLQPPPHTAQPPAATTTMSVANAKGHKSTSNLDFATGSTLKVTDTNSKISESEYDSLGRITKVWLPNRLKLFGATPNYAYNYNVVSAAMPWVATSSLKPDASGYNTTVEIYDSLLRTRQIQAPSPQGGRLIAVTEYDDRGLAVSAHSDIWDNTAVPDGAKPAEIDGGQAPIQTDTVYDGAGRTIKSITKTRGTPLDSRHRLPWRHGHHQCTGRRSGGRGRHQRAGSDNRTSRVQRPTAHRQRLHDHQVHAHRDWPAEDGHRAGPG
ncbi:hypothetical protein ACFQ60_00245 [Streptomyces zhihengii]